MSFCLWGVPLHAAESLTVGVAANFMLPLQEMARLFEERTSIHLNGTFSSTGNLYAQIRNGAPYDLFLAADESMPAQLMREGLAEEAFIYARGKVVLWTARKELCRLPDWRKVIETDSVKKIAIANPETAPYGASAVKALKASGAWERVQPKLVFAQTIAQSFQYAHTRSADVGFCALSSVFSEQGKEGCHFFIQEAPDIVQAGCILKRCTKGEAVRRLADFLLSSEAVRIIRRYGYE